MITRLMIFLLLLPSLSWGGLIISNKQDELLTEGFEAVLLNSDLGGTWTYYEQNSADSYSQQYPMSGSYAANLTVSSGFLSYFEKTITRRESGTLQCYARDVTTCSSCTVQLVVNGSVVASSSVVPGSYTALSGSYTAGTYAYQIKLINNSGSAETFAFDDCTWTPD